MRREFVMTDLEKQFKKRRLAGELNPIESTGHVAALIAHDVASSSSIDSESQSSQSSAQLVIEIEADMEGDRQSAHAVKEEYSKASSSRTVLEPSSSRATSPGSAQMLRKTPLILPDRSNQAIQIRDNLPTPVTPKDISPNSLINFNFQKHYCVAVEEYFRRDCVKGLGIEIQFLAEVDTAIKPLATRTFAQLAFSESYCAPIRTSSASIASSKPVLNRREQALINELISASEQLAKAVKCIPAPFWLDGPNRRDVIRLTG